MRLPMQASASSGMGSADKRESSAKWHETQRCTSPERMKPARLSGSPRGS